MTPGNMLRGVQVVELTNFLPGPMLAMILADQGASVVNVEAPGGDPARHQGPYYPNGDSVWFRQLNRGKEFVTIDLKTTSGLNEARSLLRAADWAASANPSQFLAEGQP